MFPWPLLVLFTPYLNLGDDEKSCAVELRHQEKFQSVLKTLKGRTGAVGITLFGQFVSLSRLVEKTFKSQTLFLTNPQYAHRQMRMVPLKVLKKQYFEFDERQSICHLCDAGSNHCVIFL
ncbi:hypothetical protein BaRGS_00004337 [Batillaria attramentaria]|uniref:Uncharacterized protein n=1 Tax=Batillaria attramentaria TaxID=370345 RepID=A0ABD0LYZ0_9CAEN